jgi:hypothetical protein
MIVLAAVGGGACGLTGGFVPGTGNVVGTLSHEGVNYTLQKDGTISRVSTDAGSFFDVIAAGGTVNFTAATGETFNVANLGTGTLTITYNINDVGAGSLNVNGVPTSAKSKNSTASGGGAIVDGGSTPTASSACADLVETCENLSFFLEVIFPIIRTDVIEAIVESKTKDPLAQFVVRPIVEAMVDGEVNKALNFCAGVQLIALVGSPPCDHQ